MDYSKEKFECVVNMWMGVPYLHAGRTKSAGVDCINFLLCFYEDLGIIEKNEIKYAPYPPDWHLHQKEERLLNGILQYCYEIPRESLQFGDLILMKFGHCFSHGAIYLGNDKIMHAILNRGVLVSKLSHRYWNNREHKYLRAKGRNI